MVPMSKEEPEGENQDSGPDEAFTPLSGTIPARPTPNILVLHKSLFTR